MWSLNEKKGDKEHSLEPLVFSNGKSQEDVVQETIKAIEDGNKIIIIHGKCGTGKSAIALNLAKEIGKASIVVPVKALQKQYEQDYMYKKYLLKKNGEKLKIKVITGRQNHTCPYLNEETFQELDNLSPAKNRVLSEFSTNLNIEIKDKTSCDNSFLPCKIEIKEKNSRLLYNYLKKNPEIDINFFPNIKDIKRCAIAKTCPYWCPVVSTDTHLNLRAPKKFFQGLCGKEFKIYLRKKGCSFYEQFLSYLDSDVLIFNSEKYKLETTMNRKPETEIEVIDECDEFLDNLTNSKKINFNRLYFALGGLFSNNEQISKTVTKITQITNEILNSQKIKEMAETEEIFNIKETPIFNLLEYFLEKEFLDLVECDEENYCFHVEEVARTFQDLFDETYISFYLDEKDLIAKVITINLEKRFAEFIEKNKILVLISGTIHSENVLKNVFGLDNFKIIDAETSMPGKIIPLKTGQEFSCSYENFRTGRLTRKQYLQALDACIRKAVKPFLVHVTAFKDLPTDKEAQEYNLSIISQEQLKKQQYEDKTGKLIQDFKNKKIDALYSTKCNRGVDFPGDVCNSIIITRFPYPNVSSTFWRIFKKTKPQYYNSFYADKSKREFLQRIYRALRSKDDKVYLLSPDVRVFTQRLF
ncbi:MAG: DEAD/DEAH box helicase family protein [Candidatus Pacearchaeota archaeon]|nr:DEAD/DEAH box helicase family protein [Candidatus Pacearchaeota archaeon]